MTTKHWILLVLGLLAYSVPLMASLWHITHSDYIRPAGITDEDVSRCAKACGKQGIWGVTVDSCSCNMRM